MTRTRLSLLIHSIRGEDLGGLGGTVPQKIFEVGGRPMHPSPQYFEK